MSFRGKEKQRIFVFMQKRILSSDITFTKEMENSKFQTQKPEKLHSLKNVQESTKNQ